MNHEVERYVGELRQLRRKVWWAEHVLVPCMGASLVLWALGLLVAYG